MAAFDPSNLDLDINGDDENSNTSGASSTGNSQKDGDISESSDPLTDKIGIDIVEEDSSASKEKVEEISVSEGLSVNEEKNKKDDNPKNDAEKGETSPKDTPNVDDILKTVSVTPTTQKKSDTATKEIPKTSEVSEQKIVDINIINLGDVIHKINEKSYDYVIFEPEENVVKVIFRQDNIDRDIVYIKYPNYTNILFQAKQAAGLVMETTGESQEGKGKIKVKNAPYLVGVKTSPGVNGEKIWLKAKPDTSEKKGKKQQKASLGTLMGFIGAVLFVGLILGGVFITFIVVNAKTVDDVKFFASLGINLNDINTFIAMVVTVIFSILLFLVTSALAFGLFKSLTTKKAFKRKRLTYILLSTFLLILTFATGSAWMVIDQKIKSLPNWQEQAYGDLKIFDNDMRVRGEFDNGQALITETENLIGPINLQFDLENFQNSQARKGISVKKYVWNFGDNIEETFSPRITRSFDKKGNYEISVRAIGTDLDGEEVEQTLSNIPAVGISHIINITQTPTTNGGKKLSLDASDLENLGKVQWYFKDPANAENPNYPEWTYINEGYELIPGKIFFDELYIGLTIDDGSKEDDSIDKLIIISPDTASKIEGEIGYNQGLEDELTVELFVQNPSTDFTSGFIESYIWEIEDKTYNISGTLEDVELSPSITHSFKNFGDHQVKVTMTDSKGQSVTLAKDITLQKRVELIAPLTIFDANGQEVEGVKYEPKTNEYYLNNIGIPTTMKFDARYVRPKSIFYALKDVSWDVGNDGNIDGKGKIFTTDFPVEDNYILKANYEFVHRKNPDDILNLSQFVYVEGVKKDAILSLDMEYDSNYAPVTVRFDASKSFIKNDDIIKFSYDYGDGVVEERDAINPGHKYTEPGDYTVKLTVTGKTGKQYSLEKKLILLPAPQGVKITTSMKEAPVGQGIDFSSAESEGQIVEYFWDFGDGNISTEANPTHSYSKPGNYTVKLRADFANKNSINDEVDIEITK